MKLSCGQDNTLVSVSEPSRCEYEMDFLVDGIRHTYLINYNQKRILKESLFFYPKGRIVLRRSNN